MTRPIATPSPAAQSLPREQIDAILFDYGNTLIEFATEQIAAWDRAMADHLNSTFGPFDEKTYQTVCHDVRTAPYFCPDHRENDPAAVTQRIIETLYQRQATEDELTRTIERRRQVFVDVVDVHNEVLELVTDLRRRYRIGLVSNFPCGDSIRDSLTDTGLAELLDVVVVSGDVGHVKPHPAPFRKALDALDVEPSRTVYVGDNWLGDIQGAKRLGMYAVHLVQYDTPEKFDREPGHHDADLVLDHLRDLRRHL
jgi:putative hydrolase of the HAD superfamily